jgi:DNA primase
MRLNSDSANPWLITVPAGDLDWSEVRDRVDLAAIATALLGPAQVRRGERGRRLWWSCPLGTHDDRNPSFCVDPGKAWWRCFRCNEHGDAPALVMRVQGVTFPEAVRQLAEQAGIVAPSGKPAPWGGKPIRPRPPAAGMPAKAAGRPPDNTSGLPLADALKLVEDSRKRLWTPEGLPALKYLRGRGLTDRTIKAARLGWTPDASIPVDGGARYWHVAGVVIPWVDRGRLAMVKIRRPSGTRKYVEAFRDRPSIFPTPEAVCPGKPLVVTEGEFDALLLAQALGELAAVATLGSASSKPEGAVYLAMLPAPTWYIATDADDAGDKAASGWPARAIRVTPPSGKDWTEAAQAGIDLRRWWIEHELTDAFDREERAAIQEEQRTVGFSS